MDAWRYGIYLLVFTFDISLVRCAHSFNIDVTLEDKFHISARPCIILYLFFYFLLFNLSKILFLLYIINFYCNIVFSPFFRFCLLIFFVSFQFLFFSPQKLTYFTMIMLGHHTGVHKLT